MLVRQPNGLFCRCDWNGDNKEINLNEHDVINMYIEQAKKDMSLASSFMVLVERNWITDDELKEMESRKTLSELMRYVPLKPLNTSYNGRDFTTYGHCPSCNKLVQDGWGCTDEKCDACGQLLKWK